MHSQNLPARLVAALRGYVDHTAFGARVISLARIFRGFRVLLAEMRRELLVALLLVMHLHLVN